ncbi:MAG: MGMT family protein [Chloroflexota bacterium]|nr:MGMT family protein [Chloroflexota bacterium]PLS79041.1 MAG: cysteine methyltransferase [Chloroflexota bacterium]
MTPQKNNPLTEARHRLRELRALSTVSAPPSLLENVRTQLGPGDSYAVLQTPLGALLVAYNDIGISTIRLDTTPHDFERAFRLRFARPIRQVQALPPPLADAIQAHMRGEQAGELPFDLRSLKPFERAVLHKALEIPRGEVRPYAWIAREIGRPQAVRAVGTALGNNPVPLLIPCHRVVRSDYRIGDYIFGQALKRAVLDEEGAAPDILEELGRAGVRYLGDPSDGTFCLPTCAGMHRRNDPQLLKLHSEHEATNAGLAPCDACRPTLIT